MNTETKINLRRCAVFLLFWSAVVLLGLWLSAGAGGGFGKGFGGAGGGNGSGSADHGSGRGRGEGEDGKGIGQGAPALPAAKTKDGDGVWGNSENPADRESENKEKKDDSSALMVHHKDNLDEDVATIHLPQAVAGNTASGGTSAGFFGIKIGGNDRIIFLLDISGSMGSTTSDGSLSRIDLLKREMKNALKSGHRDAVKKSGKGVFRIVAFESIYTFFPKNGRCSFASVKDVNAAGKFVGDLQVSGGTSMLKAWEAIIPVIKREKIATVCFLSDGEPGDCSPDQLLNRLKKAVPSLRIHTISMGRTSDLLKDVAKQHNGIYREIF